MKRRILLVDDEVAVLLTLKAVLEISGFEVDTAASGREGVSKLHTREYHMLITDMRMEHDVAGVEVIKAARAAHYHPAVALLTAFPVAEEDWQEMGADQLLVKPVHTRILLQQIEDLINSHEQKLAQMAATSPEAKAPLPAVKTAPAKKLPQITKKDVAKSLPKKQSPLPEEVSAKKAKSPAKKAKPSAKKAACQESQALRQESKAFHQAQVALASASSRRSRQLRRMFLDVTPQCQVQAHCLLHAVVQHAQPVGGWFFHLRRAQKIAGLDNHLQSVAQVVRYFAHLNREIFGNHFNFRRGLGKKCFLVQSWFVILPSSSSRRFFSREVFFLRRLSIRGLPIKPYAPASGLRRIDSRRAVCKTKGSRLACSGHLCGANDTVP